MKNIFSKYSTIWICTAAVLVTAAVFYPVVTYDFINYDDPIYVRDNPNIKEGFTLESIKWAFTENYAYNWHPLTWFSHMLDWQFFGSNAGGHHLVNLIFHITNAILIFIILKRTTNAILESFLVSILFAIHPLHVQSVAWVSERKDVLSTFFMMLTILAYVSYVNKPKFGRYFLIIIFFALGLMSKPIVVTLPVVLLLLDYWPLNRMQKIREKNQQKTRISKLIYEKIPLFLMIIPSCIVTYIFQKRGGAVHTESFGFVIRIANACVSYFKYIFKMFWPAELSFYYPHPKSNVSLIELVISAIVLLGLFNLVFRLAKNHRYLFTGWLWYLVTLVPVIGIIQVGTQAMADRYTYIPLTGLFIMAAWGLSDLMKYFKLKGQEYILLIFTVFLCIVLGIASRQQVKLWQSEISLFSHAVDINPQNYYAHELLGHAYKEQGDYGMALQEYETAYIISPSCKLLYHAGIVLMKQDRIDEAISLYKVLLPKIEDSNQCPDTNFNYNPVEAAEIHSTSHMNYALALMKKRRVDEAVEHYLEALRYRPDYAAARRNLVIVFLSLKKYDEAIEQSYELLKITPNSSEAYTNLGMALFDSGRYSEAVSSLQKAIKLNSNEALAYYFLAEALASTGDFKNAIQIARKGLESAKSANNYELADNLDRHIKMYESGKSSINPQN